MLTLEGSRMTPDTELLLAFSKTREDPQVWATPAQLESWFADHGLWTNPAPVTGEDMRRAIHVRAAMAALFRENLGGQADPRTRPTLEAVTRDAPLLVTIGPEGSLALEPQGAGVDRALAAVLAALYRCQASGNLDRLKLCKNCGYAFYDTSKNRSRIWCDMATCGSQEKARAYRQRQAGRH
jgi:predicted RNA-binding Zn ribbon-like protein